MAITNIHSLDIYIKDDTLKIDAYKLSILPDATFGREQHKSGRSFQCSITDKKNHGILAYVLDSEEWDSIRTYWDGWTAREFSTYLTIGDVPARIKAWVDKLPKYEIQLEAK